MVHSIFQLMVIVEPLKIVQNVAQATKFGSLKCHDNSLISQVFIYP